jgi:hypothetical protein
MVDIRYSPFLSHPPWSLPEFIPGCTYTALLPGDVSSLAFLVYPEFIPESPPLTRSRGMLAHLLFCRGPGILFPGKPQKPISNL